MTGTHRQIMPYKRLAVQPSVSRDFHSLRGIALSGARRLDPFPATSIESGGGIIVERSGEAKMWRPVARIAPAVR
jgi:hypothetical protein